MEAPIANDDRADLRHAVRLLEQPGLAARLSSLLGAPVEEGAKLLPGAWHERLAEASRRVVGRSLDMAVSTLDLERPGRSAPVSNRSMGLLTGAAGGWFGLPGTLLELPFTTMLMLRSIAAVAADEGEDLRDPAGRLACVEVFSLGGRAVADDAAETGYYGVRLAVAFHFSAVSEQLVRQGVAARALPASVNFVRALAARFGIAVSDKLALQMVPMAGALSGALINAIFIDHFQDMARGHFIVRRLERRYGAANVRRAYTTLAGHAAADAGGRAGRRAAGG